ncbi:MAG TPA: hypothetical protein VG125_02450 [Pirellulales bacterium]|jgi:hypothetical protein|nr:hypothetical protein [Pirellulales bacterium]
MKNDRSPRRLAVAVACLLMVGCSRSNAPTDVPSAKAALTAALESWKAGQSPDSLRQRSPCIVMVDDAWQKGEKLESFENAAPEVDDGVNLHCTVKLALNDERAGRRSEQVTYIVGTAPTITIFRDPSPLTLPSGDRPAKP